MDFFICDKANLSKDSGSNFNNAYYNSKYAKGDKGSWTKFTGNPDSYTFQVK
jgi:hypothetical protein